MNASITVESSFIYPMLIIFTVTLILYNFETHDKLSLKATAYRYLLENNLQSNNSKKLSELESSFTNVCLLTKEHTPYFNADSDTLFIDFDPTFSMTLPVPEYERCEAIRKWNVLITQLLKTTK